MLGFHEWPRSSYWKMYKHMAELILVVDVIIDWLVMAWANSLLNELNYYKTSQPRVKLLTNELSELASYEFFVQR